MNSKILVCVGVVVCSLVTIPAMAQPALMIDLIRDGSDIPILDGDGNWQWGVWVVPDASLYGATDEGTGGAVAVEMGFNLTDAGVLSAQEDLSNFGEMDGNGEVNAGEGTPNPGDAIFGWETLEDVGDGNMQAVGLQWDTDLDQVFAAFGSRIFTDDPTVPQDFLTIVTEGPSTNASLTTSIEWLGAFDGDTGLLVQAETGVSLSGDHSATASPGDANMSGLADGDDLVVLANNFGEAGGWNQANFNGTELADGDDLVILANNFGEGMGIPGLPPEEAAGAGLSAGGGNVPEPTSVVLLVIGSLLAFARIRR